MSRISLNSQSIFLGYTRFNINLFLTHSVDPKLFLFFNHQQIFILIEYGPPEKNEMEHIPSTLKSTLIGKFLIITQKIQYPPDVT